MMNVLSLMDRAAELNEDGVYELADGAFNDAVHSFENAVRQMMQVCEHTTHAHHLQQAQHELATQQQHEQTPQSCPSCPKQPSPSSSALVSPTSSGGVSCLPSARSSVEVPFLKDDRFYIYSCTVTFNPNQHQTTNTTNSSTAPTIPSSAEIAFYCATILFNLALAHHQHAQRCPTKSQEQVAALRQALSLYQESCKALHTLQQRMTPAALCGCSDDLLLMSLALCNNQACILVALNEAQAAAACFQQVFGQSQQALQEPNNFSMFEQSQVQEFLRNAMLFGTLQAGGGLHEHAAACA